jgi:predicted transcriptional regulator YdeE
MILTFKREEFAKVLDECLNSFTKQIHITALLHAIKEILQSSAPELEKAFGFQLLHHTAYGFRALALVAAQEMLKFAEEDYSMEAVAAPQAAWAKAKEKLHFHRVHVLRTWCEFWKIDQNSKLKDLYL